MVSTKFSLIAVLFIALTSTTLAFPSYEGCTLIDIFGGCRECYRRKLQTDGEGCGSLLPKSDPCLFYQLHEARTIKSVCSECKPGYASKLTLQDTKFVQECVKATLPNCILEKEIDFGQRTERVCVACSNNQYSIFNQASFLGTCQNITKPVQNCKWGAQYSKQLDEASCARCNDGYAVDINTRKCDISVEKGCWMQLNKKCVACDPFEGYSINVNGTCFKTTNTSQDDRNLGSLVSEALGSFGVGGF